MMAGAPMLTILVLALEERLTDEERRRVSPIVSMAIASSMIGLPEDEVSSAFTVAMAILERFIDKRELSSELSAVVDTALMRWETGPRIMRIRVREVRAAYIRRKQREAGKGN